MMPTPVITAWWLANDIPFVWSPAYEAYMPDVVDAEICTFCYGWIRKVVDKAKNDLIALGMWDCKRLFVTLTVRVRVCVRVCGWGSGSRNMCG